MPRKVVSRKEKAAEIEAAAAREVEAPKKKTAAKKAAAKKSPAKKSPAKKPAAKRTTAKARKAKEAEEVRKKLYWGVFSQNLKRVAVFEFDQKKQALAKAEELGKGGKSPHFVQKVKEQIQLE